MEIIRRSYKETWFWLLVGGAALTFVSEYFGISTLEIKEYTEGVVKKWLSTSSSLYIFIGSMVLLVKTTVENVQKRSINKDIILSKIANGLMEKDSQKEHKESKKTLTRESHGKDIVITREDLRELFSMIQERSRQNAEATKALIEEEFQEEKEEEQNENLPTQDK